LKKKRSPLRSIGIGLLALLLLVIYAYGFQVTKVNVQETKSETRRTQLVRIIRALAKPEFIEYDQEELIEETPIYTPCQEEAVPSQTIDTDAPYIIISPTCAEPEGTVMVEGFNFWPDAEGEIYFIATSGAQLGLAKLEANPDGHFVKQLTLPDRPSEELQIIRAIAHHNIGSPHFTNVAVATWGKIIETIFLALLATTFGTAIAVPLSFFAARNLMKELTNPFTGTALTAIFTPFGIAAGALLAVWAGNVSQALIGNTLFAVIGVILGPTITFFGVRWAIPQADEPAPNTTIRISRVVVLLLSAFLAILSLFFLSDLAIAFGNAFAGKAGSFGFLFSFFQDVGDILALVITLLAALAGGGILASLAGRLGLKLSERAAPPVLEVLNPILATIAGALLAALLGTGVNWLYQIEEPISLSAGFSGFLPVAGHAFTFWWPAAVGAVLGLALAIFSRGNKPIPTGMVIYYVSRTIYNVMRSIESLIMVIVFVVWVGIGPFAGVLALATHTIAALAKLYSEQVESILEGPVEAVKATGANQIQTIIYAVIPQVVPPYIAFTIYRWDINVRMSTIIGFAGGGGIGFLLIQNIRLLDYGAASVQMIAIAIVVMAMDYVSAMIRERIV